MTSRREADLLRSQDSRLWQTGMERNDAENVRVGGVGGAAAGLQQKEDVDWVVALQSPLVAEELANDIMRVLSQDGDEDWHGPAPHTLAFLEDLKQTLRFER